MDFGLVSLEGLVGSSSSSDTKPATSLDPEAKQKWYGSGFKQERSGGCEDDDWRRSSSKLLKSSNGLSFFTRAEASSKESQMLSFSCPKPEPFPVADRSPTQNPTLFPFFHHPSSDYYSRSNTTGFASGSLNNGGTHLGVFTQSQWMELEQQALIYKYITANVPIPSNLLLPIRKAVESARLSFFSSSFLRPNALGWGAFHMGYPASSDPEPGRCRRTDGKKWRCSRDAVADGKYCERHMNRGRHRSRKPVEGQSGHSAAASAATTKSSKLANSSSSSQASMVVGPQGSSVTNCLPINFQPTSSSNLSQASSLSRAFLEKENLVTAESFLGNSRNSSSLTSSGNFGTVDGLAGRNTVLQHPVRPFVDDWTNKSQSDCSAVSWPQLDLQSDTHLSISIPMATADYMSSTSSPANNERPLSPLRLSRDVDPIQIGVSSIADLANQRQASWIPISWGTSSMGGPLGEVLNNTSSNNSGECRNSSALNLMTGGWDSSPRMDSSPTGVLQKTTFPSLSNSSAGSSPRADNIKTSESATLCNDHGLVNPSSAPSAF